MFKKFRGNDEVSEVSLMDSSTNDTDETTEQPSNNRTKFIKRLISNKPVFLVNLSMSLTFLGIGGVGALQIPFITQSLKAGAEGYALIVSLCSIGMLLASILYSKISDYISLEKGYLLSCFVLGLSWTLMAFSPNYTIAAVAMIIAAISNTILNITGIAIIQQSSSKENISEFISLSSALNGITGSVSLIGLSLLANYLFSLTTTLIIGGLIALISIFPVILLPGISKKKAKTQKGETIFNEN
jgi:MFS family permease